MNEIMLFIREVFTSFNADIQSLFTLETLFIAIWSYLLVIWLACIIWVIKDITSRSHNIFIQVAAILLVICFTPIFGLPVYLLIRPKSTLFEQFYEETSLNELTTTVVYNPCISCGWLNTVGVKYCIHCWNSLEELCKKCGASMHKEAKFCGECGHSKFTEAPTPTTIKAPEQLAEKAE